MGNLLNRITQLAVITPDAGGTIRQLQTALGLGGFKIWDFKPPTLLGTTYQGQPEPWRMVLGIGWVGDMQVEVIQPTGQEPVSKVLD
jgi:hypothetical protein